MVDINEVRNMLSKANMLDPRMKKFIDGYLALTANTGISICSFSNDLTLVEHIDNDKEAFDTLNYMIDNSLLLESEMELNKYREEQNDIGE